MSLRRAYFPMTCWLAFSCVCYSDVKEDSLWCWNSRYLDEAPLCGEEACCQRECEEIYVPKCMFGNYGYISYTAGGGVGYSTGYSSAGLFLASSRLKGCYFQPFFDLRGHIFNDGKYAANVGVGGRYISPSIGTILGLNVYYDYRSSWTNYNQIGVGLELLSCAFDARLNGYIPFGKRHKDRHPTTTTFSGGFFSIRKEREHTLGGLDAELFTSLSKWCPNACWDTYLGVGPYYYSTQCRDGILGVKARLGALFCNFLNIEGRYSYDDVFKSRFQGYISLSFSFGCRTTDRCKTRCCGEHLREIALEPVYRNEIIVIDKKYPVWESNF